MNQGKSTKILVIGNEKGGAGKTTCSMHLIIGLIDKGYKVASIDTDSRQHSLTTYIENRKLYNQKNPEHKVEVPMHFHIKEINDEVKAKEEQQEMNKFLEILDLAKVKANIIVIDTPGSHTNLSRIAHSFADTVVTPINDSFIDLDVIAKINSDTLETSMPSIYSQMLWEQKMTRAERDRGSINWVVIRNRLSSIDAQNKRNVGIALEKLSKRIGFKVIPGFSERVIFRELFPHGLTLLDLKKANFAKSYSISHVTARHELRMFLEGIGV